MVQSSNRLSINSFAVVSELEESPIATLFRRETEAFFYRCVGPILRSRQSRGRDFLLNELVDCAASMKGLGPEDTLLTRGEVADDND